MLLRKTMLVVRKPGPGGLIDTPGAEDVKRGG